ncbi:allatostatin-A receptor-like [Asterias amurensis]|uniref:allatostatin-A receptor-like n=1 Tax=Asterias amurensis TaxID=7602 RepID=UPI003AB4DEE6
MMEGLTASPSDVGALVAVAISWQWFTIIQLVLALFGILGNSLVIIVYVKKLRNRSNSNKLIVMLAVADLITSVAIIPLPSLTYVPNSAVGRVYCIFTYSAVIMWMSIVASIFTLTLLSLERYFAIVHPIKHRTVFSTHRIKYYITAIWMSTLGVNSIHFHITRVDDTMNKCVLIWPSPALQVFHGVCIFLVEFAVPVTVMVVSHYCAIRKLQEHATVLLKRNESTSSPAFSLLRCRAHVIRMVLMVVIIFIICWSPDQVAYFLLNLNALPTGYFGSTVYRVFTILAFINSCVNPLIYICLNKNFRVALMQLVPCKWKIGLATGSELDTLSRRLGSVRETKVNQPTAHFC